MCYKDEIEESEMVLLNLSEQFNKVVLDSGASKTVAGEYWMSHFLELVPRNKTYREPKRIECFASETK